MKNFFKCVDYKYDFKTGIKYSRFKYEYINDVRNYVDGDLKIFLTSMLKSYGKSWNRDGYMYINEASIEYILKKIRNFKKNKKWDNTTR